jgi:hypothetical protein
LTEPVVRPNSPDDELPRTLRLVGQRPRRVTPLPAATVRRAPDDALAHRLDRPRFCAQCGSTYAGGIVVEYWVASQRIFHCWCAACDRSVDLSPSADLIAEFVE